MRYLATFRFRYLLMSLALIVLAGCTADERAPDISFTTLDSQQTSFTQLRGKVVFVNFWATSCPSCITEMPKLVALQRTFGKQGYETVAVAMAYDPIQYVANYTQQNKLPFKVTHDADGKIAQGFGGIMATPTGFLLDKNGQIVKRYMGEPDMKELSREIELRLRG